MADYRNRPAVDAPRPSAWSILIAAGLRSATGFIGLALIAVAAWYGVAVAAGLAWR